MKAYEANVETAKKQYEFVMKGITESIKSGQPIFWMEAGLLEATIDMLLKDGYNITERCYKEGLVSDKITVISWEPCRKIGELGTYTKLSRSDILKEIGISESMAQYTEKGIVDKMNEMFVTTLQNMMSVFGMKKDSNGGEENPEADDNTCSCGDNEGTCQCDGDCNCGDHCICDKPDDDPDFPVDGRKMP